MSGSHVADIVPLDFAALGFNVANHHIAATRRQRRWLI